MHKSILYSVRLCGLPKGNHFKWKGRNTLVGGSTGNTENRTSTRLHIFFVKDE